jgi:hypothetical protein
VALLIGWTNVRFCYASASASKSEDDATDDVCCSRVLSRVSAQILQSAVSQMQATTPEEMRTIRKREVHPHPSQS